MSRLRTALAFAVALSAAALLSSCSDSKPGARGNELEECSPGERAPCDCPGGWRGTSTCASGTWGACAGCVCEPGVISECTCEGGDTGYRACSESGELWTACAGCRAVWVCPEWTEACPSVAREGTTGPCFCARDGRELPTGRQCVWIDDALCWSSCEEACRCTPGEVRDCVSEDGAEGRWRCDDDGAGFGECQTEPCALLECEEGFAIDPELDCGCFPVFREGVPCEVEHATEAYGIRVYEGGQWRWAQCVPVACEEGYAPVGDSCRAVQPCPPDELLCNCRLDICSSSECGPEFCLTPRCEQDNPEDWGQACAGPIDIGLDMCATCHNGFHRDDMPGIETAHAPYLKCTFCHGGDSTTMALDAHVPLPEALERDLYAFDVLSPSGGYFAYLTHVGLERDEYDNPATEEHEGLAWLQFVNPGDLRVADRACSAGGLCHEEIIDAVKASPMATATGALSGARFALGLQRVGGDPDGMLDARDATVTAATEAIERPFAQDEPDPGRVARLEPWPVQDRGEGDAADEARLLEDALDRACAGCHLGSKGSNRRYGEFRSGGCSACHVLYADDGRSRSGDELITKLHPYYDEEAPGTDDAYVDIMLQPGQRPHPRTHEITRHISTEQCARCHRESAWTAFQLMGLRVDPNRDLASTYGCQDTGNGDICRYDSLIYDPRVAKRRYGLTYHQIIEYEDLNGDGVDDTPADVHWLAGLDCIDCHAGKELHGDGALRSRMGQATHVRCSSCHGTIDAHADPGLELELQEVDGSVYLRARNTGEWHFVPQVRDTVFPVVGGPLDPRDEAPLYTAERDRAHGRSNGAGQIEDGTGVTRLDEDAGPGSERPRDGFSHTDTLECFTCHASWQPSCYGCHLTLADYDPESGRELAWYSNVSGALLPGDVIQRDVVFVTALDFRFGVGPRGTIVPFAPGGQLFFRYLSRPEGADHFLATTGASWRTYRNRLGWGNRPWDPDAPAGLPVADGDEVNRDSRSASNAALAHNPVVPHTTQAVGRTCSSCHIPAGHDFEPDQDPYARQAAVVWGVYPGGASAETSAYLAAIPQTVQRDSGATFFTEQGFVIPAPEGRGLAGEDGSPGPHVDTFTPGASAAFAGATAGDAWAHRLDWIALEDGFPLSASTQPRMTAPNGVTDRGHDPHGAGPLPEALIRRLADEVRVLDPPDRPRRDHLLPPVEDLEP